MTDIPGDAAFDDVLHGTFHVGIGVITPNTEFSAERKPIQVGLTVRGVLLVDVPSPQHPAPRLQTLPGVSVTLQAPIISRGRPVMPAHVVSLPSQSSALQGVGHLRVFNDPDPVWEGPGWLVPPPPVPSGAQFIRWSARDLPDPAGFPGDGYYLGAADAADGTASITANARQWNAGAGSDFAIPLQSAWPFKPEVRAHFHYGTRGDQFTIERSVRFYHVNAAHLWADTATFLTPPFTVLIVLLLVNFPSPNYRHYIMDSGTDPTLYVPAATRNDWRLHGVTNPIGIPETFGYRTGLSATPGQLYGYTDQVPTTRVGRTPFSSTLKPRMLAMVVNGAHSTVNNFSTGGIYSRPASFVGHGAQRNLVIGRRNGILSADYSANMVVFEIRAWNKALSQDDLINQYRQLSSTWQFHEYD